MTIRVAFSGKMRSGKDTACDYIINSLMEDGFFVKRMMFADTLKRLGSYIQQECGFPVERDRELYQWLGTDYGRTRDQNVWVNALERQIESNDSAACFLAVTDMRFPNELAMLKRQGFITLRVVASEATRLSRGADADRLNHESETALDDAEAQGLFDYVIENEGSLEEYHAELEQFLAECWRSTGKEVL
jgi:dephospho-CoA kinase